MASALIAAIQRKAATTTRSLQPAALAASTKEPTK
jgi:hypothetical protein